MVIATCQGWWNLLVDFQPVALSRSSGRTKAGPKSSNTHSWPTSPLPCHGAQQMDQQRKPPNPKMHPNSCMWTTFFSVFVHFTCCSWVKDFLKTCQAGSCSKPQCVSLASSKFHIQSPLEKKKLIGTFLVTWGMMSVSIHSYFFGGYDRPGILLKSGYLYLWSQL